MWWEVPHRDNLPRAADYIICLTMGATESGLSAASNFLVDETLRLQAEHYPNAVILYTAYAFSQTPEIEESEKKKRISRGRYMGRVNNAVHEANALMKGVVYHLFPPVIVVVTDAWLSRSILLAIESRLRAQGRVARVAYVLVPTESIVPSDGPIKALHNYRMWVFSNLVRHCTMICPGGKWLLLNKGFHQPVTK